jgi:hypothetical protein
MEALTRAPRPLPHCRIALCYAREDPDALGLSGLMATKQKQTSRPRPIPMEAATSKATGLRLLYRDGLGVSKLRLLWLAALCPPSAALL